MLLPNHTRIKYLRINCVFSYSIFFGLSNAPEACIGKLTRFSPGTLVVTAFALLSAILAVGPSSVPSAGRAWASPTISRAILQPRKIGRTAASNTIGLGTAGRFAVHESSRRWRRLPRRNNRNHFKSITDHEDMECGVVLHPRLQPLRVPPGASLIAVIRIESPNDLWQQIDRRSGGRPALAGELPYSAAQLIRVRSRSPASPRFQASALFKWTTTPRKAKQEFYRELPRRSQASVANDAGFNYRAGFLVHRRSIAGFRARRYGE